MRKRAPRKTAAKTAVVAADAGRGGSIRLAPGSLADPAPPVPEQVRTAPVNEPVELSEPVFTQEPILPSSQRAPRKRAPKKSVAAHGSPSSSAVKASVPRAAPKSAPKSAPESAPAPAAEGTTADGEQDQLNVGPVANRRRTRDLTLDAAAARRCVPPAASPCPPVPDRLCPDTSRPVPPHVKGSRVVDASDPDPARRNPPSRGPPGRRPARRPRGGARRRRAGARGPRVRTRIHRVQGGLPADAARAHPGRCAGAVHRPARPVRLPRAARRPALHAARLRRGAARPDRGACAGRRPAAPARALVRRLRRPPGAPARTGAAARPR